MKVALLAAASIIPLSVAQAHTISVGYSLDGPGAVTFWYGTYHPQSDIEMLPGNGTEGSFHLHDQDGTYDQTVSFDRVVYTQPTGLIDGTTNFYSDGTQLVGSNPNLAQPADAWQGVSFANLSAGTYDFNYVPAIPSSSTWTPHDQIILSNHVTLTAQDLGGSPTPEAPTTIDGSQGSFNQNDAAATASHVVFNGGVFAPTNTTMMGQGVTLESAGGVVDSSNGDTILTGVVDGAGGLTKIGAGVLVLAGANTYSGGTTVQGGTLMGDSHSLQGAIVDNATLVFDQATDGAFNGGISGSGVLVKTGDGDLTLSGANTYNGGTIIQAGTLTADTGSLQGPVTNNASLVFNQTTDGVFSGAIDGSGVLTKTGAGELTLTGANTSTGGAQLQEGTLNLASAQALGSGPLVVTGADTTLKLGFTGTFAPNTTVAAQGGLTVDTLGNQVVASGGFSGAGGLTKVGAGDLILSGDNSLTGATTVQAGQLIVNGSLTGSVTTVEQGAVIGGVGTLGGLIVRTAATAAPGDAIPVSDPHAALKTGSAAALADGFSALSHAANAAPTGSIGKLTVGSFVVFERGSTYAVDVDASGANDRIDVTGTATLQGGTVQVLAANGNYKPVTSYTIINAAGGITGKFEDVVSDLAFLAPELSYGANSVTLTLVRNDQTFSSVADTRNQRAVGTVVDKQFGFGTSVYDSLVRGTAEDARLAFDQMSGEIHAVVQATAIADGDTVREALLDHMSAPGAEAEEGRMPTVWGTAFGGWGDVRSDGNASSAERAMGGFLMGVEAAPTAGVRLGVAGGYSDTSAQIDALQSSSDIRTGHVWAYGSAERGPWGVSGGVGYADLRIDSKRAVNLRDLSDHLSSKSDGSLTQAFVEVSYRADIGGVKVEPMASLTAYRLKADGFQEAGGVTALTVQGVDHDLSASTLGVRAARDFGHDNAFSAHMTVAWRHSLHDMDPAAAVAFRSGGQAFEVAAAPLDKDMAEVDAGIDWRITEKLSAGATYQGAVGKLEEDQAVKARLSYRF